MPFSSEVVSGSNDFGEKELKERFSGDKAMKGITGHNTRSNSESDSESLDRLIDAI